MHEKVEHLFAQETQRQEDIRQNKLLLPLLVFSFRFSSMLILVSGYLQANCQ